MKRVGLLGGMSWESSFEYDRMIDEGVRERLGGTASADLLIRSYNFAAIEALQEADDWKAAGELLARDASRLQLLVGPDDVEVDFFPTDAIHARVAVEQVLAN